MNKYKIISKLFSLSIVISILAVQAVGVIAYISGIETQVFTSIFRVGVAFILIYLIISSINFGIKKKTLLNTGLIFLIIYSIKVIYELGINSNLYPISTVHEYFQIFVILCFIPYLGALYYSHQVSENIGQIILFLSVIMVFSYIFIFISVGFFLGNRLNYIETLAPIPVSYLGAFVFCMLLNKILDKGTYYKNNVRVAVFIVMSTSLVFVLIIGQRQSVLALIIVSLIILYSKQVLSIKNIVILSLPFLISFFLIIPYYDLDTRSITRLQGTLVNIEGEGRIDRYATSIQMFIREPILGNRIKIIEGLNEYYPHNLLFEAFMSTGIMGGSIFMVFYVSTVKKAYNLLIRIGTKYSWIPILFLITAIWALLSSVI